MPVPVVLWSSLRYEWSCFRCHGAPGSKIVADAQRCQLLLAGHRVVFQTSFRQGRIEFMREEISHVYSGDRVEVLMRYAVRAVVKGDGFYQDIRQTPQSQQIPADFGVAEPVFALFNFVEGEPLLGGLR